ncbi:MAG: DegT/DnrJ/EryC1/StrS family aminotransferase [Candidatus Eremiobacteraeota bacterium]|nr:DegT/DnrJ/EryC1/StrS family aminotransferase [Candidatus Eremiobacteraeota bacterium]
MIPHNRPTLGPAEAQAAADAILSNNVAGGPHVKALEQELCQWLGLPEGGAALVSSGTAALFVALHVSGGRGRRIAMPAYACSALRNAAAMIGAQSTLLDCAPQNPNVDLKALAGADCEFAIVPHMYGIPVDTKPLQASMTIIDDAAQALGARTGGRAAGCTGRVGVLSFYATKLITTGGMGGAVISEDGALMDEVRDFLDFDCRRDERDRFNFKLSDPQAAVGREQLKRLHSFLERRAEIFSAYAATGVPMLGTDLAPASERVAYRAIVRTNRPDKMISHLRTCGISAIVPTQEWELPDGDFPEALKLARSTVSLPIYPSLKDDDVRLIVESLQSAA